MRFVCYSYDIPKNIPSDEYPEPSVTLRRFAAHLQQSVWIMPEAMLCRAQELTEDILRVGGNVDVFDFDERGHEKLLRKARACLQAEAERIRKYVEASVVKTHERLDNAQRMMSINATNDAIRFQQTALNRALRELADAEECAVAFDLSGDVEELIRATRSMIEARASAFVAEKDAARAAVRNGSSNSVSAVQTDDADPTLLGFGLPPPDQTSIPFAGETGSAETATASERTTVQR